MKCRARNQHVNGIITIFDMGYKKEWSILAPPWKLVSFNFEINLK